MNSLADLVSGESGEALDDIGCGHNELVLRCTSNLHKNRFFYVTMAVLTSQTEGEVIGSEACGKSVTKSFPQSSLAQQHCKVRYEAVSGRYFLQDQGSVDGIWLNFPVQVRSNPVLPGMELYLGPHRIRLERRERLNLWTEIAKKYGLTAIVKNLKLEDIGSFAVEELPISTANRRLMKLVLSEVQSYPHDLHFLQLLSPSGSYQVGIFDILIGSDSSYDLILPFLQPYHALLSFRNSSHSILRLCQSAVVELRVQGETSVQPGCGLRMSDLTFDICRYNVGICSLRGPRSTLEDTAKVLQNLGICEDLTMAYFSVFDGHGGITCADYLSTHLHTYLRDILTSSPTLRIDVQKSIKQAFIDAFRACDEDYRRTEPGYAQNVGSTALISMILGDLLITANLGDSRAVLCRAGRGIDLSVDHKPVI
jgi:hypothetical protein